MKPTKSKDIAVKTNKKLSQSKPKDPKPTGLTEKSEPRPRRERKSKDFSSRKMEDEPTKKPSATSHTEGKVSDKQKPKKERYKDKGKNPRNGPKGSLPVVPPVSPPLNPPTSGGPPKTPPSGGPNPPNTGGPVVGGKTTPNPQFFSISQWAQNVTVDVNQNDKPLMAFVLNNGLEHHPKKVMDANSHSISAFCRLYAQLFFLRAVGKNKRHMDILSWFGANRETKFNPQSHSVKASNLSISWSISPTVPVGGDEARNFHRTPFNRKIYDACVISDVYQAGVSPHRPLDPEWLLQLCEMVQDRSVYIIARKFEGEAGAEFYQNDGTSRTEGVWMRDRNQNIIFRPDASSPLYHPHPDINWLFQSRSYGGLAIAYQNTIGPFFIIKVTPEAILPIELIPNPPMQGKYVREMLSFSGNFSLVTYYVPFLKPFLSDSAKDTEIVYSRVIAAELAPKAALRSTAGYNLDTIMHSAQSSLEKDPEYLAIKQTFPEFASQIVRGTAYAALFKDREEKVFNLYQIKSTLMSTEQQLLDIRANKLEQDNYFPAYVLAATVGFIPPMIIGILKAFGMCKHVDVIKVFIEELIKLTPAGIIMPCYEFIKHKKILPFLMHLLTLGLQFFPIPLWLRFTISSNVHLLWNLLARNKGQLTLDEFRKVTDFICIGFAFMTGAHFAEGVHRLMRYGTNSVSKQIQTIWPSPQISPRKQQEEKGLMWQHFLRTIINGSFFTLFFLGRRFIIKNWDTLGPDVVVPAILYLDGSSPMLRRGVPENPLPVNVLLELPSKVVYKGITMVEKGFEFCKSLIKKYVPINFSSSGYTWEVAPMACDYFDYLPIGCLALLFGFLYKYFPVWKSKSPGSNHWSIFQEIRKTLKTYVVDDIGYEDITDNNILPPSQSLISTPPDNYRGSLKITLNGVELSAAEAMNITIQQEIPQSQNMIHCFLPTNALMYKPARTDHNLLVAITHRIHRPLELKFSVKTINARWKILGRLFSDMLLTIDSTLLPSIESIASKMGGMKKDRLLLAVKAVEEKGEYSKMKKEIHVKIDEIIKADGDLKPRAITNIDPKSQSLTLPWAYAAMEVLKRTFDGNKFKIGSTEFNFYIGSGMNAEQLAQLGERIRTEPTIAVAGDDSAASFFDSKTKRLRFVEADQTAFDQSEGEGALMLSALEWLSTIGVPWEIQQLWYAESCADYTSSGKTIKIKGKAGWQMPTGSSRTTVQNCVSTLIMYIHFFMNEFRFEDDVAAAGAELGFIVKAIHRQEFYGLTFLKGWWFPCKDRTVWLPLPSAILKLGKCMTNPTKIYKRTSYQISLQQIAYAISQSYSCVPDNYPILGPFLYKMRMLGLFSTNFDEQAYHYRPDLTGPSIEIDRDPIISLINQRYNIEVETIEKLILSIPKIPTFLFHPAFNLLKAVDYG